MTFELPLILIAESLGGGDLESFRRLPARVSYEQSLAADRAALLTAVGAAGVLVVRNTVLVDRELLDVASRLRVIGRLGTGLDNIDVTTAVARGIAIVDAADANANAVAEYVLGALLSLERNLPLHTRAVRAGEWPRFEFPGRELGGKTLGIVGLGRSGSRIARVGIALDMRVLGNRRTPGLPVDLVSTAVERAGVQRLLAQSDYVVLALPPLPGQRPLIGTAEFATMRSDAVLVNVARGSLVDERALRDALEGGRLRAAILDTRATEPPLRDDALNVRDDVSGTPHVAGLTMEAQKRVCEIVARGIGRFLEHPVAEHSE